MFIVLFPLHVVSSRYCCYMVMPRLACRLGWNLDPDGGWKLDIKGQYNAFFSLGWRNSREIIAQG